MKKYDVYRKSNGELLSAGIIRDELDYLITEKKWPVLSLITRESKPLTPQQLENFLVQPGINIAGICSEAGIAQQYLNRCRKAGELPGPKVLAKLLPVMVKYGFKN